MDEWKLTQSARVSKCLIANMTNKWLFITVYKHVLSERLFRREPFVTYFTNMWFICKRGGQPESHLRIPKK